MIPPSFSDLGKKARDVIEDGFRHGFLDIELKTRTASGVKVASSGAASLTDGAINADTQLKFDLPQYGLSFKEKWVSARGAKYEEDTLKSDICWENGYVDGSKVTFESSFAPASMKRKEKLKATLKRDFYHITSELGVPSFKGSASLTAAPFGNFVLGYKTPLSLAAASRLGDIAVAFVGDDVQIATKVLDGGNRLSGSLCHQVTDQLSTAFVTEWNRVNDETTFALGAEYKLDKDASMKVKVDHLSRLGLAYSQTLKHGLNLSAAALVDGKNIEGGAHQIGFGLSFDLS